MSYYPIMKAPGCKGWVTLCNFPPNNWEARRTLEKFVNVTWSEGGIWRTENIGSLKSGAIRTIAFEEISGLISTESMPFLSLSATRLAPKSVVLPELGVAKTNIPAWRSTLGLSSALSSTSYQGEIDPFPITGSLLTFGPFIQFGHKVENYLILLNLEKSPIARISEVDIFDSNKNVLKGTFEVRNNDATIIKLDDLGFNPTDLPLIICRSMVFIPLYFSKTSDGLSLSLEHTHPPASYLLYGKRWGGQKLLKDLWFSKVE